MKKQVDLKEVSATIHSQFLFSAHAPLTILKLALDDVIIEANSTFNGIDKHKLLNKNLLLFIDNTFHDVVNDRLNKVKIELLQSSCETSFSSGKQKRWFVNHFEPIIQDHKITHVLAIIREITESKNAIDALKLSQETEFKSKANLKTVFDNTRIGYVLLDKRLDIISYNTPAERMTHVLFKKKVLLGSNLRDYFPEELKITLSKNWNKAIAGEQVEYEKQYLHEDGTFHWYDIQYLPVKDEHKNVINLIMKFQDITTRKLKEQQILNFQEERFQFAIEGSNDGIWDWNILKDEVYFSGRWKRMLGYDEQEIKNDFKEWESRLHPEDKEHVFKEVENAFKNKNYSYAVEHRLKCKDGNYKWILARGKVIDWNSDEPLRMAGTHTDISDRKEMEVRVLNHEKMLAGILETLPVIVFAKDIKNEFRFSLWNKQAENTFGLKAEACIGKNDYDFYSKNDADFFRAKDLETIESKQILDIPEETVQTPNGPVLIHTLKTIVRDNNGDPLYLIGVSENIIELKKINDTLKVSEERYRSLVENSPIIIMTTDINEKIQFINFSLGGRSIEELIGESIYNFIAVDYHAMIREAHKKVFTTKKIVTYETEALDKDGSKIWFQTYVGPMLIGNEVVGLTVFTRDISERIESEEKIKKSLKEKEILLQEVHHRVKNNLQIISSILNLQTRSIKNPKFLDLIQETRYRIMSMSFIHDLLYQTTDFTNIDFSKYLQSITSNIMNTYTLNKNIDLKLDVESIFLNLDNAIPCGLIVNELITNVFKYAFPDDRKGEINIALKQINNKVVLSVADNGVGIKKQVDYKTTESLGFQLINSLVNQIDGDLAYENNNGTKFTVSFDAIKAINS
jgi:PAS domain S-box-containing protein